MRNRIRQVSTCCVSWPTGRCGETCLARSVLYAALRLATSLVRVADVIREPPVIAAAPICTEPHAERATQAAAAAAISTAALRGTLILNPAVLLPPGRHHQHPARHYPA